MHVVSLHTPWKWTWSIFIISKVKPEDILTKKYAQIVNLCLFQNRVGIGLHPALGLYMFIFSTFEVNWFTLEMLCKADCSRFVCQIRSSKSCNVTSSGLAKFVIQDLMVSIKKGISAWWFWLTSCNSFSFLVTDARPQPFYSESYRARYHGKADLRGESLW